MADDQGAVSQVPDSDRRRRTVRQLLFVIAGSHTGAFIGSIVPSSGLGLPADVFSVLLVGALFALPFVVDANWEVFDSRWQRLKGED